MCVSLTRSSFPPWSLPLRLPSSSPSLVKYRTSWPQRFFFLPKFFFLFFSHLFGVVFSREAKVWALHKRHLWGTARRKRRDCVRHLVRRSVWLDAWMQPGQQQRVETLAVCEASSLPSHIMTPLWLNSGADLAPLGFWFFENVCKVNKEEKAFLKLDVLHIKTLRFLLREKISQTAPGGKVNF